MFLHCEDIPEAEAHDGAAAESGLHEVGFAGGVEGFDEAHIFAIAGRVVGGGEAETDDAA